jgi:glycosyltransferase involved in cell wall biosynthesis
MHMGIFAERFLGRFGADRVLVILAELLRQRGHRITLFGVSFAPAVLERFPGQTVRLPEQPAAKAEARALAYLRDTHYYRQRHLPPLDACVVGSYPFITAIPYLRTIARQVIFLDFGVVPTQGFPKATTRLIESVRSNRRRYLAQTTHIVAISDFLAEDQSQPDCRDQVPVSTLLLGANHLAARVGYTEVDKPGTEKSLALRTLERLRKEGRKLILLLGRWEPGCYKNSQAALTVMRSLIDYEPDAALLVLCPVETTFDDLGEHVFSLGLPSDADLLEITRSVDAGLSVSLWEGFNLPVVEMQYQEKQAFAFRLAAHPEVVVAPEQLCDDAEEMAAKLYQTLRHEGPPPWVTSGAAIPWRAKFTWQRFAESFAQIVEAAA